jgi:hypothetical protein
MAARSRAIHHSFDILDDDDRSREIIAEALRFVAAHLTTP